MSFVSDLFKSKSSTSVQPPSAEELDLQKLNTELARRQLSQIDQLAPFQQQLLQQSLADLNRTGKLNAALDAAVTPEQQAEQVKQDFLRNQKLGPMQDEMLQLQLDQLRQGGKATPEQIRQIGAATDASIAAGTNDINTQTKRGIGLISDELANSRGLRLSDSPIGSEAALLARAGNDQIGSLTTNLRANQANAVLNYPLAVQGLQSGINMNQQSLNQNATQFQNQLRQQAYTNRLAMTGQAQSGGIGLASIRTNPISFSNKSYDSTSTPSTFDQIGKLAQGVGSVMAFSDRRLKVDFGKVGETRGGLNLHLYKYKGESPADPLRLGVMSDEVREKIPHAVKTHSSGFDVVDYGQLA